MQLPGPVRAFVGLIATTAEEAKHLPDRAIELPMLAVSTALQLSLRAQQRYARLAAKGDDVINRRPPGDEPPPWATFDAPVSDDELRSIGLADPDPAERARAASQLLDQLLGGVNGRDTKPAATPPRKTAATSPARTSSAKASSTAKKAPAKKAPAKSQAVKKQAAKKQSKPAAAKRSADKAINAPRHTAPSRFDTVDDE